MPDRPCYALLFAQDIYRDEQSIIFSKIDPVESIFVSRKLFVYALPKMDGRILTGIFNKNDRSIQSQIYIDGKNTSGLAGADGFSFGIPLNYGLGPISIESNKYINLERVFFSIGSVPYPMSDYSFSFTEGFYPKENSPEEVWTWGQQYSSFKVQSRLAENSVTISGSINSAHDQDVVEVFQDGILIAKVDVRNDEWVPFNFRVNLDQGANDFKLKSKKESIRAGQLDARLISYRLKDFFISID
jgi:hypothetical protein